MALKASITIEVNLFSNIGTRPLIYLSLISVFVANKAAAYTSRNANLYYTCYSQPRLSQSCKTTGAGS